jgi:hypothetical protein
VSPAEAALVAAGYPAGLATEIRAVHRAPEVAQRRACAARTRLERDFNVAAWLDRYVAIYLSVSS